MNTYEFQTKQLFAEAGIPVPPGDVAATPDEALVAARRIDGPRWAVKAQILAGGRGAGHFIGDAAEAGGVRFADSPDEVRERAAEMLGRALVTGQTGPDGREVRRVYIERAYDVARELYLGMLVDRRSSRVTLLASTSGGIDIERAAAETPENVLRLPIDPTAGVTEELKQRVTGFLELTGDLSAAVGRVVETMYEMFRGMDASLIEINPLAITTGGELLSLDATMTFDDNAIYRHPEIEQLRSSTEGEIGELKAVRHGLNYVKLEGNIGCVANGAGLAMATIDAVTLAGGEPANFLDLPPAIEASKVKLAFELIFSDPSVEAIIVNVFGGGIMRCDTVTDALVLANRETPLRVPLVVRLAGMNDVFARRRLESSRVPVTFASDMADAARKVVEAASDARMTERRSWWQKMKGMIAEERSPGDHGDRER